MRLAAEGALWGRRSSCWLIGAAGAAYLLTLVAPVTGGEWIVGKWWLNPLAWAAIPTVYGGAIGLGCSGRESWGVLLVGGALAAAGSAFYVSGLEAFLFLAGLILVPAPVVFLADRIARRVRLSTGIRFGAAVIMAVSVVGVFAIATRLHWMPRTGFICIYPPPGAG